MAAFAALVAFRDRVAPDFAWILPCGIEKLGSAGVSPTLPDHLRRRLREMPGTPCPLGSRGIRIGDVKHPVLALLDVRQLSASGVGASYAGLSGFEMRVEVTDPAPFRADRIRETYELRFQDGRFGERGWSVVRMERAIPPQVD